MLIIKDLAHFIFFFTVTLYIFRDTGVENLKVYFKSVLPLLSCYCSLLHACSALSPAGVSQILLCVLGSFQVDCKSPTCASFPDIYREFESLQAQVRQAAQEYITSPQSGDKPVEVRNIEVRELRFCLCAADHSAIAWYQCLVLLWISCFRSPGLWGSWMR